MLTCVTVLVWWTVVRGLSVQVPVPLPVPWPLVALGIYLAEVRVVQVHFRRETHSFSLSEVPSVMGLFLLSPHDYLLAVMVGSGAALLIHNRAPVIKIAFNLANYAFLAVISVSLFHKLSLESGRPEPVDAAAAVITMVVAAVLAACSIATVISLSGGAPQFRKLPEMIRFGGLVALANSCLAVLAVNLLWYDRWLLWLLAPPVIAVYLAYRAYVSEREKHERLELLHESSRILQRTPALDAAIVALLEHARDMFRAEITELHLYPRDQPDTVIRTVCLLDQSAEVTVSANRSVDLVSPRLQLGGSAFFWDGPQLLLGDGRALRQVMVAALSGERDIVGALMVANRMGEGSRYADDDLRLLETLANQACAALENGQLEQSLSELFRLKEQLRHLAYHDALTGLPNRTLFAERVDARLHDARTGGLPVVLFLDLDDFKAINDTLGHDAGDQLLSEAAGRIVAGLRPDDLAARMGGDEFAVLLSPRATVDDAVIVAHRLLDELGSPFLVGGREAVIGASVGIARARDASEPLFELLRNADIAMYRAKQDGKRRLAIFDPTVHDAIVARHELSSELARGVLRHELEVYYQPVVSIDDGRLAGVEALVRWNHPVRGLVGPDEFIRLAEENGSILALGRLVMAEACRQVRAWRVLMPPDRHLVLNVNVSPKQMQRVDFVDEVMTILRETGFDARDLVVEMTETAMFQDTSATISKLTDLKRAGIRIALDDFGTGYSSLGYLRRFPVDILKIAREFVSSAEDPSEPAQDARWLFATAIISLGRSLGVSIVAEGVERRDQLERLRALGCDLGQGFLFSEPLDAAAFERLLIAELAGASPMVPRPPVPVAPPGPRLRRARVSA